MGLPESPSARRTFAAQCPECEWNFEIEDPQEGEVVQCADCNLNFLVKGMDPAAGRVHLELTETDADDWGE
jgi:lysine biosynthesis protein LysW